MYGNVDFSWNRLKNKIIKNLILIILIVLLVPTFLTLSNSVEVLELEEIKKNIEYIKNVLLVFLILIFIYILINIKKRKKTD